MAISGVLRPGFIQLRVLDMDEALRHYRDLIGLDEVGREPDGRVYLKGWDEFDRHSVVLRPAATAGMDAMAFKVDSEASLQWFDERVRAWGLETDPVPAGEQPGVGRRVGFGLPSGHRIELYADMERSADAPAVENPDLWHDLPRGMGALRFDHGLLYGPEIGRVTDFFVQALDFRIAEKVVLPDGLLAVWLTCSNKAHDIAFVRHEEPDKFHHAAFFLESWHDIGRSADIMTRYGVPIDIGPTRHGITRGQTIYFFDPSGNRNEVFAGGYTYYPDLPTRVWHEDRLGKGIFYYEQELNDRFLGVVT